MNIRQFHIFFNRAKNWHRIVCWFLCFYLFLPVFAWCDHKIVLFWSAEQYYDHIMQKQVKTQKSTNNTMSIFGLIEENMELSCSFSCKNCYIFMKKPDQFAIHCFNNYSSCKFETDCTQIKQTDIIYFNTYLAL